MNYNEVVTENKSIEFKSLEAKKVWEREVKMNLYSEKIIRFALEWALSMQENFKNGVFEPVVAEKYSRTVDRSITGVEYTTAVRILSNIWKFGNELFNWHTAKCRMAGTKI